MFPAPPWIIRVGLNVAGAGAVIFLVKDWNAMEGGGSVRGKEERERR
jgi:hypothetical protein